MKKREWRRPIEADKSRKFRARSRYEKRPFYVEWNSEWNTWAYSGRSHILVAIDEVLGLPGEGDEE